MASVKEWEIKAVSDETWDQGMPGEHHQDTAGVFCLKQQHMDCPCCCTSLPAAESTWAHWDTWACLANVKFECSNQQI